MLLCPHIVIEDPAKSQFSPNVDVGGDLQGGPSDRLGYIGFTNQWFSTVV